MHIDVALLQELDATYTSARTPSETLLLRTAIALDDAISYEPAFQRFTAAAMTLARAAIGPTAPLHAWLDSARIAELDNERLVALARAPFSSLSVDALQRLDILPLALNPVALSQLREHITTQPTDPWLALLARDSARQARRAGISLLIPLPHPESHNELDGVLQAEELELAVRGQSTEHRRPRTYIPVLSSPGLFLVDIDSGRPPGPPATDLLPLDHLSVFGALVLDHQEHTRDERLLSFTFRGHLPQAPLFLDLRSAVSFDAGLYVLMLRPGGIAYLTPGCRVSVRLFSEHMDPITEEHVVVIDSEDPVLVFTWRADDTPRPAVPGDRLQFSLECPADDRAFSFKATVSLTDTER